MTGSTLRPSRRWGARATLAVLFAGIVLGGVVVTAEPAAAAPPVITFPQQGDIPGNAQVYAGDEITVSGTFDEEQSLQVYVDGDIFPLCDIAPPGTGLAWNWQCVISGLAPDLHLVEIGVGGAVPLVGADPVVANVWFVTEGVLTVDAPQEGADVYGSLTVSGAKEDSGETVFVYLDADLVTPWCSDASPGTTWTCTGAEPTDNAHTFTVRQATGEAPPVPALKEVTRNFSYESILPHPVQFTSPAGDGVYRRDVAAPMSFSGAGNYYPDDDATIDVEVYTDLNLDVLLDTCQTTVAADALWTCSIGALPLGTYGVQVSQTLASQLPATRWATPLELRVLEGPSISFPAAEQLVPGNDVTASGTTDSPGPIEVYANLNPNPVCSIPSPGFNGGNWQCDVTGLSGGGQSLRVVQSPYADVTVAYTLEGAPLTVAFPLEGQTVYGTSIEARGTADSGSSIFLDVDSIAWCAVGPPANSGGAWSCSAPLGAGAHTMEIDQGANPTIVRNFTVATALPAATIATGSDGVIRRDGGIAPSLTGTGTFYSEAPVQLTVRVYTLSEVPPAPAAFTCATIPRPGGNWGCDFSGAIPIGTYLVRADQRLAATGTTSSILYTMVVAPVVVPDLVIEWTLTVTDAAGNDLIGTILRPGQQVYLGGEGLPVGASVAAELRSTPTPLGTTVIGRNGVFSLPAVIPDTVEMGEHEFVAILTAEGYTQAESRVPASIQPAEVVPVVGPVDEESESPPAVVPVSSSGDFNSTWAEPNRFSETLRTFGLLDFSNPAVVATIGATAGGILFFVVFPALLAESAIQENYHRIFGRLAPLRRRMAELRAAVPAPRMAKWLKSLLLIAAASLMTVFVDPGAGLDGGTVRLFLAMFMATYVVNYVVTAIVGSAGNRWYRALPQIDVSAGGLFLVLGSVLFSRLVGVEPGVLFAVLIGLQFGRALREVEDARLVLLGTGLSLGLGVSAWIGYSLVSSAAGEPTFWSLLWQETLATITVEAIVALIVLMLPLAFLDGKVLWNWSKRAWLASYALVLVVFAIVIMPMPEEWADFIEPSLAVLIVIGTFTVACVALWGWFQLRPSREAEPVLEDAVQ